jgi:hypothetical protein
VGYTLPKCGSSFQKDEVRNAFLAQTMENPVFEDSDRDLLSKFLEDAILSVNMNSKQWSMMSGMCINTNLLH